MPQFTGRATRPPCRAPVHGGGSCNTPLDHVSRSARDAWSLSLRSHDMSDSHEPFAGLAMVELIAMAIRDELGEEIEEEHPGFRNASQAGHVNRAFVAAARAILEG